MTGFDILALLVVGFAAVMGFMRGFVREVMALLAWIVALIVINLFHTPLTHWLVPHVHTDSGAAVLAFALCALVPYFAIRLLAGWLSAASHAMMLGPIDRVLGFGFGAVKGSVLVVLAFSVLVLGYDTVWGPGGRPDWLKHSRTYPFVNASSEELVRMIGRRHQEAVDAADAAPGDEASDTGDATAADTPAPTPSPAHHAHHRHHAEAP